jgi:hypothetical protein
MTHEDLRETRQQLQELLGDGHAHMTLEDAVRDFPPDQINTRPPNVPYTFWHLLEHIRRTQHDILDYIRNAGYEELDWPADYWPGSDATTDAAGWAATLDGFRNDLAELRALLTDEANALAMPAPTGAHQSLVREILTVADHNAYHIGEFAILRQVGGLWPAGHG